MTRDTRPAGLSEHSRHLWRAAMGYRSVADALAANAGALTGRPPVAEAQEDACPAFR